MTSYNFQSTLAGARLRMAIAAHSEIIKHAYLSPDASFHPFFTQSFSRVKNFALAEHFLLLDNRAENQRKQLKFKISEYPGEMLLRTYLNYELSPLPKPVTGGTNYLALWEPCVGVAMIDTATLRVGDYKEELDAVGIQILNETMVEEGLHQAEEIGDYGENGNYLLRHGYRGASAITYDQETLQRGVEWSTRAQQIMVELPFGYSRSKGGLPLCQLGSSEPLIEINLLESKECALQLTYDSATGVLTPAAHPSTNFNTEHGVISHVRLVSVLAHLGEAEASARANTPTELYYTKLIRQSPCTTERANRKYPLQALGAVQKFFFTWRDKAAVGTEYNKRHLQFGAYNASNVQLSAAAEKTPQQLVSPFTHAKLDTGQSTPIVDEPETYFRNAHPSLRCQRRPKRYIWSYSFDVSKRWQDEGAAPRGSTDLTVPDNVALNLKWRPHRIDSSTETGDYITPFKDNVTAAFTSTVDPIEGGELFVYALVDSYDMFRNGVSQQVFMLR